MLARKICIALLKTKEEEDWIDIDDRFICRLVHKLVPRRNLSRNNFPPKYVRKKTSNK